LEVRGADARCDAMLEENDEDDDDDDEEEENMDSENILLL